ncbi:hypothetical protein K440DRAFT_673024 [Wilcoxina mikolae CBS 423.85]|nr:hypothetical protein K440DRAFT_673024 [Wilcoxina mikolae CBS 423.85]
MVEPISIVTGCATLIGLALRTCKLLNEIVESIQDAPSEIRTILADLKSVEAATAHISQLCANPDSNQNSWPNNWLSDVEAAIEECLNSVMDLMNLARRWKEQKASAFGKALNGFRWSLRERDVMTYKRRLDSSKATLIMLLGTWTMMTGNQIGQQLGQVHDMVQGLVAEHIVNANEPKEVVSSDPRVDALVAEHIVNANEPREAVSSDPRIDALVAERIVDNQTEMEKMHSKMMSEKQWYEKRWSRAGPKASSSSSGGPSAGSSYLPGSSEPSSSLSGKARAFTPLNSTQPGASSNTTSDPVPSIVSGPNAVLPTSFANTAAVSPTASSRERRGGRQASVSSESISSLSDIPRLFRPRNPTMPPDAQQNSSRSDLAEKEDRNDKIFVSQVGPAPYHHIDPPLAEPPSPSRNEPLFPIIDRLSTGHIRELSAEPLLRFRHRTVVVSIDFIPLVLYYGQFSLTVVGWGNQPGLAEDLCRVENCVTGDGLLREDLLRCFLRHFYLWIESVLKRFFKEVYQHAVEGMQYLFVIPASWGHAQANILKTLLTSSDFRDSMDDTSFILDSEAILWSNTALPLNPSREVRVWRKRLNPLEVAVVVNVDENSGSIRSFRRIGDAFRAQPFLYGEYFPLENLKSHCETTFTETFTSLKHVVARSVYVESQEWHRLDDDLVGAPISMERFKMLSIYAAERFITTGLLKFSELDRTRAPENKLTCEIDSEMSKRTFYISTAQLQRDITAWIVSLAGNVLHHIIGCTVPKARILCTDALHILMVGEVFDSPFVKTLLEKELQVDELLSLRHNDTSWNYALTNKMAKKASIRYLPHRTSAVLTGALARTTIHDLVVDGVWLESDLVVERTDFHGHFHGVTSRVLSPGQSWLPTAKLLEYDYMWRAPDEIWEDGPIERFVMFRVVTESAELSEPADYPPALVAPSWAMKVDRKVLERLGFVPGVHGRVGTGFKPPFVVVKFKISFVVEKVGWVVVLKGSALKATRRGGYDLRDWDIDETEDEWKVISSIEKGFGRGGV